MTSEAQTWLPASAFAGFAAVAPLSETAAEWSEAWFAREDVEPDTEWQAGAPGPALALQAEGNGFALYAHAERRTQLVAALLGEALDTRHVRTEADRALVDRLVDKALADLAARIGGWLKDGDRSAASPAPAYDVTIALRANDGTDLVHLATRRSTLIRLLKRRAAPARPAGPLSARLGAVRAQQVELAALVGRASLSFQELQGLEVGDVIALDDPVETRRDLLVAGRPCASECVAIAANDDRLSLVIERAAGQW